MYDKVNGTLEREIKPVDEMGRTVWCWNGGSRTPASSILLKNGIILDSPTHPVEEYPYIC